MAKKLVWGILSTGRISGIFAAGVAASGMGELAAVGSRTQEAAERFGDKHNIPRRYGSYESLLADPEVEAVYISTPHPMHSQWAIRAADAGKHILCEKPLTMNYIEAIAVIEAARRNDVFLMEAFMYRCHPQTTKLIELIRERVIGDVRVIQAGFSFDSGWNPESRILNADLGGGGILDVGCYCTSMCRLIAGAARGRPFEDPVDIKASGHIGKTGVDEWTAAILTFSDDIIAQVSTGVQVVQDNLVRIYGSRGSIVVPSPWFCRERAEILVNQYGEKSRRIVVKSKVTSYTLEADVVAASIANRQAPHPAMTWDDTLGNMKTLDSWRHAIGLTYPNESK